MARIRTVKPDFFRHEALQDLEAANPGLYPMLVFAGLWGHCDKAGRFEWKPRHLKLDILPFLNFEMSRALTLLEEHGFLIRYAVDGKDYGWIPTFREHQRIGGKEAQEAEKYPPPPGEAIGKQPGSDGEAVGIAGREGKGMDIGGAPPSTASPGINGKPSLRPLALEVLAFLNEKAGRNFEPLANLDFIVGRLKEGASVEVCKAVIEKKCQQWGSDEKMAQYLRPKTLFSKTNFANYKGELRARSAGNEI